MKQKSSHKATKISLGHKHVWTDTSGHAHHVSFDSKTNGGMKPRTTALVLILATAIGATVGAALVATSPKKEENASFQFFRSVEMATPSFDPLRVVARSTETAGTALVSGWDDEFFLADISGVTLYNAKGEKLDFWANDEEVAPTALAFCSEEQSPANGLLTIAYPTKVKALRFSLDNFALDDEGERAHTDDSVVRSARKGALGVPRTILTVDGANIRGIAIAPDRLFVADLNSQRVWRYSLQNLEELVPEGNDRPVLPDCELGAPDDGRNFPGLKPAFERNFCIAYLPQEKNVVVVNSGLFRLDAFDATSGAWISERSWAGANVFSGAANPIAVACSVENWLATAEVTAENSGEKKAKSPVQLFSRAGEPLRSVAPSEDSALLHGAHIASLSLSSDSRFLYALDSNGDVDVWTRH